MGQNTLNGYLPVAVFMVLSRSLLYALIFGPTLGSLFGAFTWYGASGNGMVFFSDSDPKYAIIAIKSRGNLAA
ncbi:MAG: hypothetical protein E2O54_12010, partial [Gammaproteobacteria bacterium]